MPFRSRGGGFLYLLQLYILAETLHSDPIKKIFVSKFWHLGGAANFVGLPSYKTNEIVGGASRDF